MVFARARANVSLVLAFGLALACTKHRPTAGGAGPLAASAPHSAAPSVRPAAAPAAASPETASPDRLRKLVIDGAHGVLVPGRMVGANHFTPTEADARKFELGLVDFLARSHPPEDPELHRKVGGYVRQYTGGTWDGRRLLFVTFACREDPGWGERFLVIHDGGSCYFDVEYDLDAGVHTHVLVHHDA